MSLAHIVILKVFCNWIRGVKYFIFSCIWQIFDECVRYYECWKLFQCLEQILSPKLSLDMWMTSKIVENISSIPSFNIFLWRPENPKWKTQNKSKERLRAELSFCSWKFLHISGGLELSFLLGLTHSR